MSAQGLEVIDHSVLITHEWINELSDRLGWSSKRSTLRLFRTVLHQIRDHLQTDELAQLSAQLPLLVRGMFFEGWVPKNTPLKQRHVDDFVKSIEAQMNDADEYRDATDIKCVFETLNNRLSAGEIEDVRACLPSEIRAAWPPA